MSSQPSHTMNQSASPAAHGGAAVRDAKVAWLAAFVGAVCFLNVLPNDFTYDDHLIVRTNPFVIEPGHWLDIWTADMWRAVDYAGPNRDLLYRPATITSYRLIYALFGDRALPQLVVNVLLHALICALVVRLAFCFGADAVAALMAGLVFAVLPIHTEVVAGVVGRADLLACGGVLVAVLAYRRAMEAVSMRCVLAWIAVSTVSAFVAVCSKENAIAVFPLVVLLDWHWSRRRHDGDADPTPIGRRLARLVPLGAAAVVYLMLRYYALDGRLHQETPISKTVNMLVDAPAWQHALGVVQLWGMYWSKTIWPAVLSIKYSINAVRPATSITDPHVLIGLVAGVALIAACIIAWRRGRRDVAVLTGSLLLCYAPTSNVFVLMQVFFAERIWYLPSVWVCILAALGMRPLLRYRPVWFALCMLILAMTARSWARSYEWRNNGTLFAAAYRDQPNGAGPLQLYGDWLAQHGKPEEGIALLRRAIAIDPGFTDARVSLGQALLATGASAEAAFELRVAVMQDPANPVAQSALARARGRAEAGASPDVRRARQRAERSPQDIDAQLGLVEALRAAGLMGEAIELLEAHDMMFDQEARWHAAYAVTLMLAGRRDDAIDRYRHSVDLAPAHEQARIELAMLLLERRTSTDIEEAKRLCATDRQDAPATPNRLACQAEVAVAEGDVMTAIKRYERAIDMLPSESRQRTMFEQRRASLGK